jgi:hypothetical protein
MHVCIVILFILLSCCLNSYGNFDVRVCTENKSSAIDRCYDVVAEESSLCALEVNIDDLSTEQVDQRSTFSVCTCAKFNGEYGYAICDKWSSTEAEAADCITVVCMVCPQLMENISSRIKTKIRRVYEMLSFLHPPCMISDEVRRKRSGRGSRFHRGGGHQRHNSKRIDCKYSESPRFG